MSIPSQRLTVNNHHGCIVLMNAVKEYCERESGKYQAEYVRLLRIARQEADARQEVDSQQEADARQKAKKWLQYRMEMDSFMYQTLDRLNRMREKFESYIPQYEYVEEDGVHGGHSTDNATCYN